MGGPDMAPHTPRRSERPGAAVALLDFALCLGDVTGRLAARRSAVGYFFPVEGEE